MITLLAVQPQDIKYFTQWWRDSDLISVTSGDTFPLSDSQIQGYFKNLFRPNASLHFMIDRDGHIIGHISLQQRSYEWWETQVIIGERKDQGLGYGSEAIRQLLDKAGQQGINRIYLEVRPDNAKAIRAYQKVGFSQVGEIIETNNPRQPELIRMELNK